ncbi:MAG: FkbM family methyltransferase [Gemmataceae bacterium]
MSADQTSPQPEPAPAQNGSVSQSSSNSYRLLFYVASLTAIVSLGMMWNYKSQIPATNGDLEYIIRDKKFTFTVDAYGFKYQGTTENFIDENILQYGAWEKHHLFFIRDYLKNLGEPNGVAIDVGANTGHHSLFYSRHTAKVLAIEPFPPVIELFKRNLAINPEIQNISIYEVGFGDAAGELPFLGPVDANHGVGAFRPGDSVPDRKQLERKLPIVVGDEFLKDKVTGPVVFIKVDVEGFEEPVLKGLRQTMDKYRPLVEVELSPPPMGTIDSIAKIQSLLPENYELYDLPWSPAGSVLGSYELRKFRWGVYSKGGQYELIACPKERAHLLPGRK